MFESIVSKITSTVRSAVRAAGAATRNAPWLTAAAVVALFFVL
ncbi:MAG TPA: hypothetical protein VMJ10_22295 [Kofleriaceae bacterium]|nr:hypothetical protein [Kofleriaceae bacterium]